MKNFEKVKIVLFLIIFFSVILLANNSLIKYHYNQGSLEVSRIRASGETLRASRLEVGLNAIIDSELRNQIIDYCSTMTNFNDCLEERYPILNSVLFFINFRLVLYILLGSSILFLLFLILSLAEKNLRADTDKHSYKAEEMLMELKTLLEKDLISPEEYGLKRKEILEQFNSHTQSF